MATKSTISIKDNDLTCLKNFLDDAFILEDLTCVKEMYEEYDSYTEFINSEEYKDLIKQRNILLKVYSKILNCECVLNKFDEEEYSGKIELTKEEAKQLYWFIDLYILEIIRKDESADNVDWVYNILNIWNKCKKVI